MRTRRVLTTLLPFALIALATASMPGTLGNYQAITQDRLRAHLEFVASDLLEGRNTPSRGLDIAAAYLSAQLKLWGLQPAGDDGTFIQRVIVQTGGDSVVRTQNVVAIVPGSDPELSKEYVAFGAHYDHIGLHAGTGDTVNNGADDDGSGTVSILEIAHAFATGPRPKRSMLFVWHCGEEKGLWGSKYFVEHPTVPIGSIVTELNIDMIGRSKKLGDTNPRNAGLTGPDGIYVIGSTRLSTQLGEVSESVNRRLFGLTFDYHYDKPNDPENLYRRSDHFNYALKGIPIIFYFDGIHEDYHQPGDEVSKIDFRKMERVAQTVYATGWTVGNLSERPRVDGRPR